MNEWNEGYFTESAYTYGYYKELNPVYLRYCLLVNGVDAAPPPPAGADSDAENHCELGFGQGVTVNIHAAANAGNYFGTDFNPAHAAHANTLCQAAGSGAKLFENSFEEFLKRDDLPQFDSISLHGIFSWVTPENQQHIIEFARKFLKPGGIFYNSYNCYPGWAPGAPLRELLFLYDKYAQHSGKTFNRVEEALKFTEKIISTPQGYFNRVPDVKQIFENIKKHNHDYLAHEYFNQNWMCPYFNEVAEMFQAAKLDFACTAGLLEQREKYFLPANCTEILNTIESPIMREQVKDYFLNRQFRKDISVRGAVRISPIVRIQRVISTTYVLNDTAVFPAKINVGFVTMNLNEKYLEKIYEYLAAENYRPKDFKEFVKKNPDISAANLEEMLIILANAEKISPCQNEDTVQKVDKSCRALNKYICERAKLSDEILFLASPVTGGGVALPRFERIFTAAIFDGLNGVDEIANYAWNAFESTGQRLIINNKVLNTAEENIAEFAKKVKTFIENRLPIFKLLKIV